MSEGGSRTARTPGVTSHGYTGGVEERGGMVEGAGNEKKRKIYWISPHEKNTKQTRCVYTRFAGAFLRTKFPCLPWKFELLDSSEVLELPE